MIDACNLHAGSGAIRRWTWIMLGASLRQIGPWWWFLSWDRLHTLNTSVKQYARKLSGRASSESSGRYEQRLTAPSVTFPDATTCVTSFRLPINVAKISSASPVNACRTKLLTSLQRRNERERDIAPILVQLPRVRESIFLSS